MVSALRRGAGRAVAMNQVEYQATFWFPGTRAQVAWSLRMHSAPLRVAARVAYPLMRWGHDRVVDMAVAGFRQRALPGTAAQTPRSLIQ
jgi:hypothetical protein